MSVNVVENLTSMLSWLQGYAAQAVRVLRDAVPTESVYKSASLAWHFVGAAGEKIAVTIDVRWVVRAQVVVKRAGRVPRVLKDLPDVAKSLANRRGGVDPNSLFELIPRGVRLTEETIKEFLKRHDVSHIEAIKNNPAKASDASNVRFEPSQINRARGARDMTPAELKGVRIDNLKSGCVYGIRNIAGAATKGAVLGALMELPVTCLENAIHLNKNRKTPKQAVQDVAKDAGNAALAAGGATATFTGLSLLGMTLGPAAAPLAIIGGVAYLWSAQKRIWQALDEDSHAKLIESESVLFLASVARFSDGRDCISTVKMLPE